MKLTRNVKYGIASVGFLLILIFGLTIYSATRDTKTKAIVDPTVCEYCGAKLSKGGECSKCISEQGLEQYRAKRESKKGYNNPLLAAIIVSLLAVLVLVHVGLIVHAYFHRKKTDVYYHVRCPKCGRKLRYRSTQVDRLGRCPLCQKSIRFPQPPEMSKPSKWREISWQKIRQIVWD